MERHEMQARRRQPGVTEYATVGAIAGAQLVWVAALAWLALQLVL